MDEIEFSAFEPELHIRYFLRCLSCLPTFYEAQESSRLTMAYFCIVGLDLLQALDKVNRQQILDWVYSLQVLPSTRKQSRAGASGFRGSESFGIPRTDFGAEQQGPLDVGHLAMTYTALAILATLGDLPQSPRHSTPTATSTRLQGSPALPTASEANASQRADTAAAAPQSRGKGFFSSAATTGTNAGGSGGQAERGKQDGRLDVQQRQQQQQDARAHGDGAEGPWPGHEGASTGMGCEERRREERRAETGGGEGSRRAGEERSSVQAEQGRQHCSDGCDCGPQCAGSREAGAAGASCSGQGSGGAGGPGGGQAPQEEEGGAAEGQREQRGAVGGRLRSAAIAGGLEELQLQDGSFTPIATGAEADMRFVFCAAAISFMLGDCGGADAGRALSFIRRALAYDGGFSLAPGNEAHGGAMYCAVAALLLINRLQLPRTEPASAAGATSPHGAMGGAGGGLGGRSPDGGAGAAEALAGGGSGCSATAAAARGTGLLAEQVQRLVEWCCMRQGTDGGFQGRRHKASDTCYAFWVGGSLHMLGFPHLVQRPKLAAFLRTCQDEIRGGFSKHPAGYPDVLHSFYGVCALSLLGHPQLLPLCVPLGVSRRAAQACGFNV